MIAVIAVFGLKFLIYWYDIMIDDHTSFNYLNCLAHQEA